MYVTFTTYPQSQYQPMSIRDSYAFVKTGPVAQSDPNQSDPPDVVTHIFEPNARPINDLDTVLRMIGAHFRPTELILLNNLCIPKTLYDAWQKKETSTLGAIDINTLNQKDNVSSEKVGLIDYQEFEQNAVAIIRRNRRDKLKLFAAANVPVRAIPRAT
tara:strand:- start:113 stop:589 length:477 start_codon:yes stop_codon:yes gene_type:complete